MDMICQRALNQGFLKVERYHSLCQRQVKAQLPRSVTTPETNKAAHTHTHQHRYCQLILRKKRQMKSSTRACCCMLNFSNVDILLVQSVSAFRGDENLLCR